MDKLRVKENFELPSGIKFTKGEMYLGHYKYWVDLDSKLDKKKDESNISNLVIVYTQIPNLGAKIYSKDYFELVK